jgi:hypothetical protein
MGLERGIRWIENRLGGHDPTLSELHRDICTRTHDPDEGAIMTPNNPFTQKERMQNETRKINRNPLSNIDVRPCMKEVIHSVETLYFSTQIEVYNAATMVNLTV